MAITIGQRSIDLFRKYSTKADVARVLLDEGYSINEISKAVPMSYSQVHSVAQKHRFSPHFEGDLGPSSKPMRQAPSSRKATLEDHAKAIPTAYRRSQDSKPKKTTFQSPRVGKLRTGGLPRDIEVGECANCGFDLVVRQGGATGWMIIHVNTTTEEYLGITQFCQGIPKVLVE